MDDLEDGLDDHLYEKHWTVTEAEVPLADGSSMEGFYLWFERDASWTNNFCTADESFPNESERLLATRKEHGATFPASKSELVHLCDGAVVEPHEMRVK